MIFSANLEIKSIPPKFFGPKYPLTPKFLGFGGEVAGVIFPLGDEGGHVGRKVAVEVHLLACLWMHKAQCLGMKGLTRAQLEAVVNELGIAGGTVTAQDLVAAIAGIVEQRVTDVLHVDTDLVGAACL